MYVAVIKKSLSLVVVLTTFLLTTNAFAMKLDGGKSDPDYAASSFVKRARMQVGEKTLENTPDEIKKHIFMYAAHEIQPDNLLEYPANLRLVCHDWRDLIDAETEYDERTGAYIRPSSFWNELKET